MLSLISKRAPVKAKVIRWGQAPCLVASFQTCSPAIVWHLDLDKTPNVTLTLRETDGEWELGYMPAQGDFVSVVRFDDREDAEEAYACLEKVLLRGCSSFSFGAVLKNILLSLVLFVVAGFVISFLFSGKTIKGPEQMPAPESSVIEDHSPLAQHEDGEIRTGVPVNADDVLPKDVQ